MRFFKFLFLALAAIIVCACHPFHGHCAEIPDIQRIPVGESQVLAILDAPVTFEQGVIPDAGKYPDATAAFTAGPLPGVARVFYFTPRDNARVLVDAGWGNELAVKGKTRQILQANGIRPEDITDVLLTHMDFDHLGGLLEGGKAVYPNARLHVARPEFEAWQAGKVSKRPKQAIDLAHDVAKAYTDRTRLFEPGDEIFPGVVSRDASGHTPGHVVYDIVSNGEKLTIGGDIAHVGAVQLAHPDLNSVYDMEPQKAASARERIFSRAAEEKATFAGMHIPAIGRLQKAGQGYDILVIEQGGDESGR